MAECVWRSGNKKEKAEEKLGEVTESVLPTLRGNLDGE
jgi:hypothetical protein